MFYKYFKRTAMVTLICTFAFMPSLFAMHIMEGFLPLGWCIGWGVLALPVVILGFRKIGVIVKEDFQHMIMIAMTGAFAFILSSLKIPSVTGSSSHMTGVGFGAIMFGPALTSVLAFIVLLFQAVLLAHGGLSTIGANTFSMGVAAPFATFAIYKCCKKMNLNKKVSIFLAAMLGDLVTYIVTSIQLALAFPSEAGGIMASMTKFLGVFALTQVPLAIVEGILTVIIIDIVSVYGKDLFDNLRKGGFLRYEG